MKKFLILIIFWVFSFFSFLDFSNSACEYNWTIEWSLDNCLSDSTLVWAGVEKSNAEIWKWFDKTIQNWTKNISLFLWIFAVLGIVYGSFMLTTSAWEDEKINKAKDTIKWSIIGFIWLITASFLINLLVKVIYSIKFN